MRVLVLLPLLALLACSIPGMQEFNTRIDDLKTRLDQLEATSRTAQQVDLAPLEQRVTAIEGVLASSGVEVSPEATQQMGATLATLDSISVGLTELSGIVTSTRDSLSALGRNTGLETARLDSLETRMASLQTEIAALQSTVEGLRSQGTGTGSSGGTSRGGTSGGSSGRGGTSGGSSGRGGTSGGGTGR